MKKGDKRKQRKASAKRARRQGSKGRGRGEPSVRQVLRRAGEYPIVGCWTMEGWQEAGIAPIVIARRQPDGRIAWGVYMVDLFCLGLKETYCNVNYSRRRFYDELLPGAVVESEPLQITPALAHEIIYGSIAYAGQFGFRPQRDYRDSRYLLDPEDAHPRSGTVEFGRGGKPLYIEGPYDNVRAILRQLERTVGEGNYHYMYSLDGRGPPPQGEEGLVEDDWDDWDEEEEE